VTSVAVIGLGSRGLSLLERIVTLAREPVRVEVIDPRCDGAGVHDTDQPDYLLLNTTCGQVSMFPDAHTVGADAGEPGPSLYEWVVERDLRLAEDGFTVGAEGRAIRPTDFLPRRVLGAYLGWFFRRLQERAASSVQLEIHQAEALDLDEDPDGGLVVTLSTGASVRVEHAFLTTGYTANIAPPGEPMRITEPYPLPDRVREIAPGASVAIAGFGLSAMDVMSCLTVGRGGRFIAGGPYVPSGDEPTMLFYSRSGLPCRARPKVVEFGPRYTPLVFTRETIDALRVSRGGPLDFDRDVLPLILQEMRVAYRRAHGLDDLGDDDGFDPLALFDGSADMLLEDGAAYQKWFTDVLSRDLAEGVRGFVGSPVKAALDIMRELRDTFRYAIDFGGLTPDSLESFHRYTVPAVNRAVVGPQFERHSELLALIEAGIAHVPFGPAPSVVRGARGWTITSTRLGVPYSRDVDWLLDAYVSMPTVASSASPLLAALHHKGWIRAHLPGSRYVRGIDVDPNQHPITASGRVERRISVLGPLCEGATFYNNLVPSPNTWSRPVFDAHRCVAAVLAGRGVHR